MVVHAQPIRNASALQCLRKAIETITLPNRSVLRTLFLATGYWPFLTRAIVGFFTRLGGTCHPSLRPLRNPEGYPLIPAISTTVPVATIPIPSMVPSVTMPAIVPVSTIATTSVTAAARGKHDHAYDQEDGRENKYKGDFHASPHARALVGLRQCQLL